jgi:hypothetical protein
MLMVGEMALVRQIREALSLTAVEVFHSQRFIQPDVRADDEVYIYVEDSKHRDREALKEATA